MPQNDQRPDVIAILNGIIQDVAGHISEYCENPGKDFTRTRKLPADIIMQLILNMEGQTLNKELYNHFPDKETRMTTSAYVQQREKLKAEVFKAIFELFNRTIVNPKTINGLRMYAIDGSDICTPTNKTSRWYIPRHYIRKDGQEAKGTCLLHGNFLYDLPNKQYVGFNENRDERTGAIELIDSIANPENALVIMDRGYTGYNMVEHCNRYGGYYVIRFPVHNTFKEINELPDASCDKDVEIKVSTRSQQFCEIYGYRKLSVRKNKKANEDYSEQTKDMQWDFEDKCTVKFRICKFKINDPESGKPIWEVLVTNLPRDKFDLKAMKRIYWRRWGIETSFKELKYAVGLINFHSRQDKLIMQELYAGLIIFNATARIAAMIPIAHSERGFAYAVDLTMVVHVFRVCFRPFSKAPPDEMYADMSKYRHMLKDGRHNMRLLRPKSAVYFTYRVS